MYVVKSNVNGVKRWAKVTSTSARSNKTGKIGRKSLCDDFRVTFKPYYTRPRGRYIFYEEKTKDFSSPSRWGTQLLHGKSAASLVKDGWKVWVVKDIPPGYT